MTTFTRFKLRRDTAANWTAANPILLAGEPALETDTGQVKYGDGVTAWSSLAYFSSGGGGVTDGDKGDIVVSGGGTAWAIDAKAVTLAKQADMATGSVVYRKTAGSGPPEVQTLATLKSDLALNNVDNTSDAAKAVLTATKLATARTIAATGDITWSVSFDGSGNATAAGTLATVNSNTGTFGGATTVPQFSVNGKGLITGVTAVTIAPAWSSLTGIPAAVSALSGTNTGDQTIALTGDVTGSGAGSFAATIAAGAVTLAKQANVATGTVFYRKTAGSGAPEVQALATLKADLGLSGTNSGDQDLSALAPKASPTFTGTVTLPDTAWINSSTDNKGRLYFTVNSTNYYKSGATDHIFRDSTDVMQLTIGAAAVTTPLALTSTGATAGIGYATGAGGAVTQATSRTTGVTLNKVCGAITLFSKTTTASLVETFTVTNSAVAATDVVEVCVKSGTGIYLVFVTNVANGSFKISVFTPAAVASAEAPVISFCVNKAVAA